MSVHRKKALAPEPGALHEVEASLPRAEQISTVVQELRIVFRAVQEHSRWVERQCGVSAAQLWALWELFSSPGLKVTELAETLAIHPSTTSNMLDKMCKKDLVRKHRSGPDQRVVRLYITDKGADLLADAPRPAQGALTAALQRLPQQDLLQLKTGLNRLLAAMSITDREAALSPLSGQ